MLIRIILFTLLASSCCFGQLPNTNIYMMTITKGGGKFAVKSPVFLTAFNKNGYNNQPSFVDDDQVLFTTNYYGLETDQTEISKFDFFEQTLTRITYTDESEYSPKKMASKEEFSCVRVESDKVTQSLSVYPMDGIGYAKRLLHNTNNIGYYEWLDDATVGMFLVEEPHHNLAIADSKSERRNIILDKIGRSLHKSSKGELYFIHKQTDSDWYIKAYNLTSNKSKTIAKVHEKSEDFELMNDGSLIVGVGSILYRFDPKSASDEWKAIADLSGYGIKNISRLVSRKNRLVVVTSE